MLQSNVHLAAAEQRVRNHEGHVARQAAVVAGLGHHGDHPESNLARTLLVVFEVNLNAAREALRVEQARQDQDHVANDAQ